MAIIENDSIEKSIKNYASFTSNSKQFSSKKSKKEHNKLSCEIQFGCHNKKDNKNKTKQQTLW